MTFVELYLKGTVTDEDINDYIHKWHLGDDISLELHEYLGMTWDEYAQWVQNPYNLKEILTKINKK